MAANQGILSNSYKPGLAGDVLGGVAVGGVVSPRSISSGLVVESAAATVAMETSVCKQ